MTSDKSAIRDAATVIVVRKCAAGPKVLMGQRGATAAFMPNKYVFPGGAVDPVDAVIDLTLAPATCALLGENSDLSPQAIAAAAIRELWEETGQILGDSAVWPDPPKGWRGFAATGHRPKAAPLEFIFRAVTPTGRPRRFDARFFMVDAAHLTSDPDDFSRAEDELSHLHWVPLTQTRNLDLPFITEVVLAELNARLNGHGAKTVPFFANNDEAHAVARLGANRARGD